MARIGLAAPGNDRLMAAAARIAAVVALALLTVPAVGRADGVAESWVANWGDKWWERYHPDYDARYPGGRSNRYHDLYIAEAMKRLADTSTSDWNIFNKHYFYDDNWFIVEWLYESTQTSTGLVQRESTLAFGEIVDDRLRIWVEYFDDMVGAYQWIGAMPLYGDDELPYPWPASSPLKRAYRP